MTLSQGDLPDQPRDPAVDPPDAPVGRPSYRPMPRPRSPPPWSHDCARGVRHAVLAPGSRSAPLAFALHAAEAAGRLRLHTRFDERSAGFLALGIAAVTHGPVVVVTTSGTAVAHLHPAVMEADHRGLPLVLLTADRPARMRGTQANQTTDQVGVYGRAARLAVDLEPGSPAPGEGGGGEGEGRSRPGGKGGSGETGALPDEAAQVARWQQVVDRVVATALGRLPAEDGGSGDAGPVQLNVQLTEPLVPDVADGWSTPVPGPAPTSPTASATPSPATGPAAPDAGSAATTEPDDRTPPEHRTATWRDLRDRGDRADLLDHGPRTVVVAGDDAGPPARILAERNGWPLLAEPTSGSRTGDNAIRTYRLLLADPQLRGGIERVVVCGHPTLSRPVTRLISDPAVEVVAVRNATGWTDPGRVVSRRLRWPVEVAGGPGRGPGDGADETHRVDPDDAAGPPTGRGSTRGATVTGRSAAASTGCSRSGRASPRRRSPAPSPPRCRPAACWSSGRPTRCATWT